MSSYFNDTARNVTGLSTDTEAPLAVNWTYIYGLDWKFIYGLVLCTVSISQIFGIDPLPTILAAQSSYINGLQHGSTTFTFIRCPSFPDLFWGVPPW